MPNESIAGLPRIALHDPATGARAGIALHGAHLLSWIHEGRERLFLSELARTPSIRGGVPVIFPQFGLFGDGPKHGFARSREWRVVERDETRATLELRDDTETRAVWPHAFELRLHVSLHAQGLSLELEVHNSGGDAFLFAAGLHGYLAVDDVASARVHGLADTECLDAARDRRDHQAEDTLYFHGEVDRVYFNCRRALRLDDGVASLHLDAEGFPDTVIWNPGDALASTLADLGAEGGRRFVCIEAAQVLPRPLAAGATWRGAQHFTPL